MDLLGVVYVEAEEVDQLTGTVDLRLVGVLALGQHGGRVDLRTVWTREQVGGLQEDGRAMLERHVLPLGLGLQCGVDGGTHVFGLAMVRGAQVVRVFVRWAHLAHVGRFNGMAGDPHRRVDPGAQAPVHLGLQCFALRCAGCVAQNGFVGGGGDVEDGVGHGTRLLGR